MDLKYYLSFFISVLSVEVSSAKDVEMQGKVYEMTTNFTTDFLACFQIVIDNRSAAQTDRSYNLQQHTEPMNCFSCLYVCQSIRGSLSGCLGVRSKHHKLSF